MQSFERKNEILNIVEKQGKIDVNSAAELLRVTKVTIRSDIDDLARRGLVVRTHGGAVSPENRLLARPISRTIQEDIEQKEAIAEMAAKLISPGSTILLDAGSTTVFLARRIKGRKLTVVTNSVLVIQELYGDENIELHVAGGNLRKPDLALIGDASRHFLSQLRVDIVFLGATSFSVQKGLSCSNFIEGETKKTMISSGLKTYLLADSSKSGKVSLAHVCDWDSIDALITDHISPADRRTLEEQGVDVITP